jgi:glutaredoxin
MSTNETCPHCQKAKENLTKTLIEGTTETADTYKGWSFAQLETLQNKIAQRKHQTAEAKHIEEQAGRALTIGNQVFGRKPGDTGQPNTFTPGSTIGNSLFGKKQGEV